MKTYLAIIVVLLLTASACTLIFIGGNGHSVEINNKDSIGVQLNVDSNSVLNFERSRITKKKQIHE